MLKWFKTYKYLFMKISALIIARNEEKKIELCLRCLKFADEIVVILDRSTDGTEKICKSYTSKIHKGDWEFEGDRRNFGIKKCSNKWILEIDADELISKQLASEIKKKIKELSFDYYYINLVNYINKKPIKFGWMSCLAPDGKFALFKKNSKVWENQRVHPNYSLQGLKGVEFKNFIDHYMSENISDLILRFNRNTSLKAKDYITENRNLDDLFSFRKVLSRFLKSYINKKGFKNGFLGIIIGILNSVFPLVTAIKTDYLRNTKR